MVRQEVILRRLTQLDECLRILHDAQRYSEREFSADPERYGSVERFLQLAVEALTDMGNHVVAYYQLGTVDTYGDVPQFLFEADYINEQQREGWIRMIGFRNVLVHGYLDIDRTIVYRVLQDNLGDIESLRDVFAQMV